MSHAPQLSVEGFFDPATHTVSYLLLDTGSRACALIDSVLDYDPKSGRTRTDSADRLIARVAELGATVHWLLETHVHADHLSAAPYLKAHVGGQIAIGSHVRRVQDVFGTLFNAGPGFAHDGSQFDRLLDDGDTLALGALTIRALHGDQDATVAIGPTREAMEALAKRGYDARLTAYPGVAHAFDAAMERDFVQQVKRVVAATPR